MILDVFNRYFVARQQNYHTIEFVGLCSDITADFKTTTQVVQTVKSLIRET